MSERKFGLEDPSMGLDPAAELTNLWENQAEGSLQTEYGMLPIFEDYFAEQYPRAAKKVDSAKETPSWARQRLSRAQKGYLDAVSRINQANEAAYIQWQDTSAEIYIEASGLALMAGEESLADELLSSERVPEGRASQSEELGMALLASGYHDDAKHILLRRGDTFPFIHAQNLLDAYRVSDDPDYRNSLVQSLGAEPYLLARLAAYDLSQGRNADDLFDAARGNKGISIAVAAVLAKSSDAATALRFGRYLDRQAEELQSPDKKWLTRAEMAKKTVADEFRREGIFAPVTLALNALEVGLDVAFGGGLPEIPRRATPEYRLWWDQTTPLLAEVWPLLVGRQGFDEHLKSFSQAIAKEANTVRVQQERSEWGESDAAVNALGFNKGKAHNKLLAYRHLLRDAGAADAMGYIGRVPEKYRRKATYYSLVTLALEGAELHTPQLPDMTDTYGPILALQRRIMDVVGNSLESVNEAAIELAGTQAEADTTSLDTVGQVELASLFAKIQKIPDRLERERQLKKLLGEEGQD